MEINPNIDPSTFFYLQELGFDGDNPEIFVDALLRIANAMKEWGYETKDVSETYLMVTSHLEKIEQGEH